MCNEGTNVHVVVAGRMDALPDVSTRRDPRGGHTVGTSLNDTYSRTGRARACQL